MSHPWRPHLIELLRSTLGRGLLPFRAADPLSPAERRSVAALWGAIGSIFGCGWVSAFLLFASALGRGIQTLIALALVPGAAIFVALAGYAMVGLVNGLLRRSGAPSAPSGAGERSTRDSN